MKACKHHKKMVMGYCKGCDECRRLNKLFKVSFHYEEGGTTVIKAKSQKDAEQKVYDQLEYSGINELDYECQHRDYNIL